MDILNVIEVKNNDVVKIESFDVVDDQLSGEIVEEAEQFFADRLVQLNVISEEDIDKAIEDGCYHGANWSLSLVWSHIDY